jgi:7-dehydrocholesterol reductase
MNNAQGNETLSTAKTWGRAWQVSLPTLLSCILILTTAPLFVLYVYISAFYFDFSLREPFQALFSHDISWEEILSKATLPTLYAAGLFSVWLGLQVVLSLIPDSVHRFIPAFHGGDCLGSVTPAGRRLNYNINGFQAWLISHALFILGTFVFGWFSPTIIFDNWGALLWIANLMGFGLAIFAYIKANRFPSSLNDRKFSGNKLYDFFMGIELNPRIGLLDLKLFFNGRPGIVAWTLINFSFAAEQYVRYGHVTNSMILVNILQALYVLYFFWNEAWYLKTIDIHHDHFGWMLAWGDCVWLPYMYTLQGLFLVFHPVELSTAHALLVLAIGLIGFYIFASANMQKDKFRQSDGRSLIWGKKPESIACQYTTEDGTIRESKLLVSGWWKITRHMNYTGDLLLSLAYSLACGTLYVLPYFYFVFLSILLIHRCIRDEKRCKDKYGEKWNEYTQRVPYRLIPYVW